jgi:hypothetical protein
MLFLLLVVHLQCNKKCCTMPEPDILPPVTQEGKNTFGCRVNGEVWTPWFQCTVRTGNCKELGFGVSHADTAAQLPLDFTLSVRRSLVDTVFSAFDMYTGGAKIKGTGNVMDSVVLLYFSGSDEYYRFPPGNTSGVFNLTKIDTVNRIIAGTFSFTLYNTRGDSVVVTEGRFDLIYNACLCH